MQFAIWVHFEKKKNNSKPDVHRDKVAIRKQVEGI